ncbi:hypothetical protein [Pseudoalteromonas sp. S16_S37]|uniref:hypothetical protein n=1 Tax=Pseudoalteromonas sp. S16_S37 TaxID=2720228 RepID=UPI001680B054|nr:hypothetical protein [Pseudoalteromonas sp. S16_S37]MBD1584286.1 hypothetical protein [Pseudoalteromonas sp. S16_S37]
MKTSMTLKLKSKKLKELSAENAKKVAGGTLHPTVQPQANGGYWYTFSTLNC